MLTPTFFKGKYYSSEDWLGRHRLSKKQNALMHNRPEKKQ